MEELSSDQSEPSSFKLPYGAKWVTNWAYYEGEERLGQVRFFKTRFGLHSSVSEVTPTGKTVITCLLYTSPSPRDLSTSRMPSSA